MLYHCDSKSLGRLHFIGEQDRLFLFEQLIHIFFVFHQPSATYESIILGKNPVQQGVPRVAKVEGNGLVQFVAANDNKNQINPLFMTDLISLTNYDFCLVLDDSGSMQSRVEGNKTRWQELLEVASIAVEIGAALDDNGVDVLFLNREGRSNVRTLSEIKVSRQA